MKVRFGLALAAATLIGGASLLAVQADAQNGPAPADRPVDAAPTAPPPPVGAGPRDRADRADRAGRGDQGPRGDRRQQRPQMTAEDRTAFFEARVAAVHAGLRLTADQEKMWPSVESAVRDLVKTTTDLREKARASSRPAGPFERMKVAGEASSARGAALTKMADAMIPLWASLSDDQKRRFRILSGGLMAHPGMAMQQPGQGRRDMMERGPGRQDMRGRDDRDDRRGARERDQDRRGQNDDRRGMRGRDMQPGSDAPSRDELRQRRGENMDMRPFRVGAADEPIRVFP